MKIGIDIDDTIAKTNEIIVEKALQYDKEFVKGKGFKDKNAYSFMEMFYWTVLDVDGFFKYLKKTKYYAEVEPKENAAKVINKLREMGHKIVFITRRDNNFKTKNLTKKWLKVHGFQYDKLLMNTKKKGEACTIEGINLFIDNDAKNVIDAKKYNVAVLLMKDAYNKDVEGIRTVENWKEVYYYINGVR